MAKDDDDMGDASNICGCGEERNRGVENVENVDDVEEFPVKARGPSMRKKIAFFTAFYVCTASLAAYQSNEAIHSSFTAVASQSLELLNEVRDTLTGDVKAYQKFLWSSDPEEYDWRDLAERLRQIQGVSKVTLGGQISCHFPSRSEAGQPSSDDVIVMFNDLAVPYKDRVVTVSVVHGRMIEDPGEVVVSRFTLNLLQAQIGSTVELFGSKMKIVGVSSINAGRGPYPVPHILMDFSHIHEVVINMRQRAEGHDLPHDYKWFTVDFELQVFTKGRRNLNSVRQAIQGIEDDWPILKEGAVPTNG